MRIIKNKWFNKFARKSDIEDATLVEIVKQAERGLIDADLGRDVIKMRVARAGQGKRGGFRAIVAYRQEERSVFLFGYAKSEREDLEDDELEAMQDAASVVLGLSDKDLDTAIAAGKFFEVKDDEEESDGDEKAAGAAAGRRPKKQRKARRP